MALLISCLSSVNRTIFFNGGGDTIVLELLLGKDSSTAGRNLVGSHGQLHPPAC